MARTCHLGDVLHIHRQSIPQHLLWHCCARSIERISLCINALSWPEANSFSGGTTNSYATKGVGGILFTMTKKDKLSTEPYKGVRDFYPEDQFVQKYIFEHMERVCELFGYEEYSASILEPAELYRGKTSEEIVNEQTYTFTDRGGREVTLRPEVTPTLARMIAARSREIPFPARWYTIANCFRYERPQKGRVREHWQLNADIVGVAGIEADVEIIAIAHDIMRSFGADERSFEIRVSDRRFLDVIYDTLEIANETRAHITRLLDKREDIEHFEEKLAEYIGTEKTVSLLSHLERTTSSAFLEDLRIHLEKLGVTNMTVDPTITRGFDYYTGMVFEVYDTSGQNKRALFGGGRYDTLLSLFGNQSMPAVGFGMGDVRVRDFLETHGLIPAYAPATELMLCVFEHEDPAHAQMVAQQLRHLVVAVVGL